MLSKGQKALKLPMSQVKEAKRFKDPNMLVNAVGECAASIAAVFEEPDVLAVAIVVLDQKAKKLMMKSKEKNRMTNKVNRVADEVVFEADEDFVIVDMVAVVDVAVFDVLDRTTKKDRKPMVSKGMTLHDVLEEGAAGVEDVVVVAVVAVETKMKGKANEKHQPI